MTEISQLGTHLWQTNHWQCLFEGEAGIESEKISYHIWHARNDDFDSTNLRSLNQFDFPGKCTTHIYEIWK